MLKTRIVFPVGSRICSILPLRQVVYSLAPSQAEDVYQHFSVSTLRDRGVLKLKSELDFEFRHLYQV